MNNQGQQLQAPNLSTQANGKSRTGMYVALVALLLTVIGYYAYTQMTKKDPIADEIKKAAAEVAKGPQIQLTAKKTVNPEEKTEEFTEYMTTEQQIESGKLIDIGLGWTTTTGFDIVGKLVFKRLVNGKQVQEDIEYTGDGIQNHSEGEILFDGEDIEANPVGSNKIEVYYVAKDSDKEVKLTDLTVEVNEDDLAMTTSLLKPKVMIFKPKAKKDSFTAEKISEKVFYVIKPNSGKSILTHKDEPLIVTLDVKKSGEDDVISFKYTEDGAEKVIGVDGVTDFILKKKGSDTYYLTTADGKAVTSGSPTSNKINLGGAKGLITRPFDEMTPLQYRASPIKLVESKEVVKFPKEISGLTGRYVTNSCKTTSWDDISGAGNHCTDVTGKLHQTFEYVYGSVNDGFKIPTACMGENNIYTLFYVARYNGLKTGRIFNGMSNNWLSGFHGAATGCAHRGGSNGWLYKAPNDHQGKHSYFQSHGKGWIQGTDQANLFRFNGKEMGKWTDKTRQSTSQIVVNVGEFQRDGSGNLQGEVSDWAIKELLIYNRELSEDEIRKVELYLEMMYPSYKQDLDTLIVLDPEEKHRNYSNYYKNGSLNQSMLSSTRSWSAAGNDADSKKQMEIDIEHKYKIVGVVIKGRGDYQQYPKTVNVYVNNKLIQDFDTSECYPEHVVRMFRTPVVGSSVQIEITDWNRDEGGGWPSMRAGVIVETGYGPLKFRRNLLTGYPVKTTYPSQLPPEYDMKASGPLVCQKFAEANKDKYALWGFRTLDHDSQPHKGTCWFGNSFTAALDDPVTLHATKSHFSGCADPNLSVESGCTHAHSPNDGFKISQPGKDRPYGDIENYPVTATLDECKLQCAELDECVGISYDDEKEENNCYAKKNEGLRPYAVSNWQFYEKAENALDMIQRNRPEQPVPIKLPTFVGEAVDVGDVPPIPVA